MDVAVVTDAAKAIVDSWYDTGDTFRRDARGYYTYCRRSGDVFKVSGRWVSPHEIESILIQHPQVFEAAVISRKNEHGLAHADAWVVPKDRTTYGPEIEKELRHYCEDNLPRYKLPGWIHVAEKLPKTATGKIQRYKLRGAVADQDRTSQEGRTVGHGASPCRSATQSRNVSPTRRSHDDATCNCKAVRHDKRQTQHEFSRHNPTNECSSGGI